MTDSYAPSRTFLGFDFGLRRIGVAAGQTFTQTATPLTTLIAIQGEPQWHEVTRLIKTWQPDGLVVGIPLHMNGSEQAITTAARQFAQTLAERYQLPIYESDERLSSASARTELFASGGYKKLQQKPIDSVAAQVILEQWLREYKDKL